jgi:hypothetical protein
MATKTFAILASGRETAVLVKPTHGRVLIRYAWSLGALKTGKVISSSPASSSGCGADNKIITLIRDHSIHFRP